MKLIKVINKRGEERNLERAVAENMVSMFPNDWKIVEDTIEKPKKRKKSKDENEEETN